MAPGTSVMVNNWSSLYGFTGVVIASEKWHRQEGSKRVLVKRPGFCQVSLDRRGPGFVFPFSDLKEV